MMTSSSVSEATEESAERNGLAECIPRVYAIRRDLMACIAKPECGGNGGTKRVGIGSQMTRHEYAAATA